jgi:hypothetical protein
MTAALVGGSADDLDSASGSEFTRGLVSGFTRTTASACAAGSTAIVRSDATAAGRGDSTVVVRGDSTAVVRGDTTKGSVTAGVSGVRIRAAVPGGTGSVAAFVVSTCDVGADVACAPLVVGTEADAMLWSDR